MRGALSGHGGVQLNKGDLEPTFRVWEALCQDERFEDRSRGPGFEDLPPFRRSRSAGPQALSSNDPIGTASRRAAMRLLDAVLRKGLGEGRAAADLLADRRTVAEGAYTAPVLQRAAAAAGVDMPIVDAVCALLSGDASVDEILGSLLSRPLRAEGL